MAAQAGPKDGRIVNGSGSISHSGTHTDIHQNSDFLSTRWGSFNIGANESVQAHQPGASSRLLIRVDGGGATNIAGSYTSNGITILENRNGVQFSRGAIVNVGGLLATSSRISGVGGNNWQLNGTGGAVVNHGTIAAGAGGAILAAVKVQNTGDITAQGGDVALGAGSSFTVDFAGSMVGFEITKAASGASITNSGKIEAQGGVVALSAQEAQAVRTNVVSVGGVVKATRIERRGGVVYLSGGTQGVAEVSGDVQASKKVQTTGEYVVVKEGAVLTAPDILVGGNFQGRGNVPTAQRTLVERGALLDAGAEGRVIVWSDEITWFNGNINVPGGFAEVSGKRDLATVNLPGINVGAGGTLLLDPWIIDIGTISTTTLPADGIQFDDGPSVDGTPPIAISAADVGNFVGNLELQARRAIRINADITSTTLTSLTLRAQDADNSGADNTQNGGDGGDANNIRFNGAGRIIDLGEASFTVISGVINILGASTVQITARGGVTFRYNRDNYSSVADTVTTNIVAGALTTTADTTVTYAFGLDAVADNISATAINCAGQTSVCSITRATDENVQISSGNLSASESLTIDINLGVLSFAGTGLITVSAPTVSITAGSLDIGTRNLIIEATGGSLTLNTPIINGATGVGASRVLRAVNGSITIGDNIAGAGTGNNANIDSDLTISSTGTGAGITLGGDIDLRGRNIELTGAIAGTEGTSRGLEIRTVSLGNITLNSNINLQGGELDLRTDRNGGRIITTGSPVIMVGVLSLLEGANTETTDTGYTANLFSTMSRATTEAVIRVASNATAAVIHPWMAGLNAGEFILQAVGGGAIPMITLPASFVSTGDIILRAGAIALSADATTTLSGAAVTLTGGITGAGALNLTATDRLTLNSGIDIDGDLAIIAGERINLATPNTVITAGGAFTINFTDPDVANDEAGFTLDDGTATLGNLDATNSSPPAITFIPDIPDNDCVINGEECSLIRDDANLETADASLESDVGITISIGTGTLTFGGGLVEITIDAPTVSITAGNIDIGTRALTITASGGALTLNTPITADAGSMGNVEIFATNGALTIGGDINTRGGALTLSGASIVLGGPITLDGAAITLTGAIDESGMGGNDALTVTASGGMIRIGGDINLGTGALTLEASGGVFNDLTARTLTASMVSLTQDIAFSPAPPFTFMTPTLNLTATTPQPFYLWMVDRNFVRSAGITGRNLSLTGASITFTGNVNAGGGNLTLVATGSGFTLDDNRRLEGAAITLTGFFSGDGNNFTITATDDITLNSNIEMDGGNLTLTATGSNIVLGDDITLDGGTITLTGAIDASDTGNGGNHALTVMASGAITLNDNINTGTGALSLSSSFGGIVLDGTTTLRGGAITLTGGIGGTNALTVTATGALTLNSNINIGGTGDLTLSGMTIALGGDATTTISLTGRNVTLTGVLTANAPDLTIMAGTAVMLNDNINTGAGDLTLMGANIALGSGVTSLEGNAVSLTGVMTSRASGTAALAVTADGALTINNNIDIGTGALALRGATITLGNNLASLRGGAITLTGVITRTGSNSLTVMASGVLRLNDNIATGVGNTTLTLRGDTIVLGGPITLTGTNVTLTGAIDESAGTATNGKGGNDTLTIMASGFIRLNDNIDLGTGILDLTAGAGGSIDRGASQTTLAASEVRLTQGVLFDLTPAVPFLFMTSTLTLETTATDPQPVLSWMDDASRALSLRAGGVIMVNADITAGTSALTLNGTSILLNVNGVAITLTGGAVTLTGAVDGESSLDNDFTITASGDITINNNIDLGTGALTLDSDASIVLVGPITLDGEAITLTGALTSSNALTINAGGRLTLNSAINLGGGTLAITTDERIAVPSAMTLITAGAFTIVFTDPVVQDTATGFVGAFTNLTGDTAGLTFAPPLAADCTGQTGNCSLGVDGTDLLVVATLTLAALDTLTIDIGTTAMLTFDGIGAIMITARAVTITAGTIDIGGRNLEIRTTNGKLTLNTSITNAGRLILFSASAADPGIILSRSTMLSGVNIDITGVIAVQQNLTVMATDTLTLNSDISILGNNTLSLTGMMGITLGNTIELVGTVINLTGEIGGDNGLTIRTNNFRDNMLTLNSNINTGTGDLTLNVINDMGRIVLGSGLTSLDGAAITLTGVVTRASGDADLGIMATGALTLNNNITIGALGTLTLMTGAGAIGGDATELTAGTVSLNQVAAFDPTAPFTFGSATSLTLTTATDQTVHGWMVDTTNNRALSLTTTGAITANANIDTGTRALTLMGTSIFLRGGARTLEGSAVTLSGILDSRVSGDSASANNIIITADTGDITINGGITASGNDGVSSNEPGGNGGAVDLTATLGNIMITGDIITTGDFSDVGGVRGSNGGALTLMAPDGNITIGGSINLNGARAANFQQVGVPSAVGGNGGSLTLMAGDIMIGNVNARGGRGGTAFGVSTTAGDGGNGGVIMITARGTATISGITASGGEAGVADGNSTAGSAGAGGRTMITASGGDLTLRGSINVSGGALTLRAPGNNVRVIGSVPTLTASTVTINQGDEFANNLVIAEATSLILTTTRAQIVRPWMTAGNNRSLSLTSNGAIIINADITLGSGNLTLIGMGGIQLGGVGNPRRLSGADVSLTGVINVATNNLIVTATGQLTLNSNINIGTRTLTLIAGTSGTGEIMNGDGTRQLNAGTVSLTQASAFDATFAGSSGRFTFASGVNSLVLDAGSAPQTVHDWMVVGGRSLDLTTTGAITIGMDIPLGAGSLTLDGGTLTFTGSQRILSGAAISLSGNATNAGQLNISASGQLTLNSDITPAQDATGNLSISGSGGVSVADGITLTSGGNLTLGGTMVTTAGASGNGNLTLTAAGTLALNTNINLGTGTATLNAGSDEGFTGRSMITAATVNIVFSSTALTSLDDVPIIDPDASPAGVITFVDTAGDRVTPMIMYGARECNVGNDCVIRFAGALVVQHQLTAVDSITIEAIADGDGVSSVRFGGERATITLTAPLVTIIAETINLEGRNLVIVDTNGGRLTLSGNVSGAAAITARNGGGTTFGFIDIVGARTIAGDAITLTATLIRTVDRDGSGVITDTDHDLMITATDRLTIATDINTGTGTTLTLTAGPGDITGTGTPMLTADTVSLTQAGAFGGTALFMFATGTSGRLNLTTAAGQRVESWMFAVMDRDLSVTSTGGRLLILGDINIRAGDLTLSGMRIELDQNTNAITLTAGAVSLTGNVDGALNTIDFTIMAGGILTLNNNIDGTGDIMLTGTSIVLGDDARTLDGGAIMLTGAVSATNTPLTITASGDITINNNINLGTGALILTATGANIVDVGGVVPVLTASTVSLTQAGTFAADLFTLAAGVTSLTLDAGSAAQTVHAWMVDGTNNRTLSLTTTGAISIGRDIATGTSNLTLVGGTLTLTAAATLSGADIALSGNLTSAGRALTITAADNITITGNINTGGSNGMGGDPAGSNGGDGGSLTLTATSGNITISGFINTDGASGGDGVGAASSGGDAGNSGNVMITADGTVQIGSTISATGGRGGSATGSGRAGDGGNGGVVDISGSVVTVNAVLTTRGASGNVGSGGNPGAGGTDGRAMITATGGNLTIERNVSVGSGTLTLEARGAGSAILNDGTRRTLTAGTVSLTQVATFASGVLFTFTADTLNLTTAAAQTVHGWMTSGNRSLNLTSTGREIATGSINTGTGDLTLSALAIELMGSPSFIGRNVVLDGPVDGRSGGSGSFTVMATGNITINGNVNVGAGTATSITLTADSDGNGTGNILSDVDTGETLTAGTVSLTQAVAFAPTALFTFDASVGTLNLTTAAPQTVHNAWMVATGRNLSLTSNGGSITVGTAITASEDITLTATTININADIGTSSTPITGSLTLDGDTLAFSGPRTLSGANISLTGAATNADDLTITTAGTLTIAASIAITGGDLMLTGSGIVIGTAGTATGRSTLAWSGDAITLAGAVTTASSNGAANLTDLTITAQGVLTVAGIDLSNNDDTAHGALALIAGAGTQTGDITFVAGAGGILNAASVELRQDTDFNAAVDRPVDILINGMEPGLTGNPESVTISGDTQVPWAAILVTVGDLTITDDGGDDDPDDIAGNTGIVLATARLSYTGNITLNAGAGDITFETGLGNITWEAANITITAGSIVLGARTLTITAGEGGTLTLNVTSIIATGTNDLAFAGTTIRLGRTAPGSATGTTTLTGAAITLTAANGITVGRFSNSGAFISTGAPILVVNASGAVTIAADITSVARINLGSADNAAGIAVTGARTLSGSLIRFNSDVTANDGLTVNSTAGNLIFNGNITTGTSALSLTSAAAIRILGEANATRTLTGGDITLTAANGVEAAAESNLTVTASGVLTIAAGITTTEGTLTLQGAGAIVGTAGRPRLTASTVSLTQIDVFGEVGQFRFTADSLVLTNTAAAGALQDVHNWMIGLNRNLTLTSPARVRVAIAIGASVLSRNLGDGSITLMSTGADIRIRENISTTGNIILSGSVGINFNGRAAKTLSGADITLTGAVVSNRDLTLTASGTLTLNSDITATASNLVLTGGGGIDLGSALTLTGGGDVTLTGMIDEAANGLTITAVGTLTINSDGIATGSGDLSLTGAAIRLGRTAPGSDTGTATLTGAAITLTAANGITVGRFNNSGVFISTGAPALMVTASGVLTIAANIRSVADITLEGTGGIVIGTATGSSALLWRGSDITLTGAVTTASTAGIDNFTSLTVRASGNLVVGAIDLGNDAGGSADDWGDLRLRADTGTITVTGVSTIIDAGSILFQQDAELFDATEPANLHINGEDVSGTPSLRSMVLVFSTDAQISVAWGTVIGAGAIVRGTSDAPQTDPIMLNNGVLLSLVSITINAGAGEVTFAGMGDITLAAPVITITAGSINTNNRNLTITTDGGTLTLISNIATGTGDLTLTSGTIQIGRGPDDVAGTMRTLSGVNITLTAADGILLGRLNRGGTFLTRDAVANFAVTASGTLTIAADITVDSTATSGGNIALTGGDIAFGAAARTISGVDITLMGDAAGSANLTLTASGTLTLNSNINTGAGALTLSGAGAIVGAGTPELTASTVSLRQAAAFAEDVLFTFGSATDSLELTTTVNQDVHDWMINDGIDLTVESPGRVRVEVAIGAGSGRDLGTGDLTLTSTGGAIRIVASITTTGNITLSGATGINLNSTSTSTGTVTLTGAAITLSGNALINRALTITATDALRVENNITLTGMSNLTLMSTGGAIRILADISTDGNITLSGGGTIGINLNSGAGAKTFSGAAITLTGNALSNRDLTLDASGILTLNDDIIATSTSALSLSGSSVALGGALTLTGGDITLTGAATGGADLTITASGTLTINNDINTGASGTTLTLRGAGAIVGSGRPRLTAGTVSLAQDAAFGARPFNFGTSATPIGSLELTTEAAQDVLDWMIVADRNLTVTSAANVFVRSAIGSSVDGRDLGDGSITLTSTGGAIRILAGISTTGDLTLDASTLVNLNSGAGAKTLSGAIIMLTGDALSNRDLTLTASGALTLNGGITATASNLVLTGGTGGIDLSGGARTISGVDITLTGVAASDANVTINASGILTINSDITLTGTGLTLALRGAGAIGDGDSATALTASTVRLRQVAAFAVGTQFTFGSATGSLLLITDTNQDVYDWMINDGINLTVRSSARVRVMGAAIGSGNRVLGAGSLTLRSTGAAIRILANITTSGAITLDGATGINTRGGARTFSGEGITLNGAVTSIGDDVIINANGGILSLSSDVDTRNVTDPASPTFGNLTLTGETIEIGRRATDTPTNTTRILLRGENIMLTSASGIQIGRITRDGFFLMNDSVANFIVTADGTLTIAADITVASTATLGGDIALTSRSTTPIAFTGARTITGRDITLTGAATGTANLTIAATGILTFIGDSIATGSGNLSLTGATINLGRTTPGGDTGTVNLTGSAITLTSENGITVGRFSDNGDFRPARAPALVVDASGVLTIAAAITSVAGLTLEGADAIVTTPDRPRLTASTVSLTQIDAFTADGRGRGLFRFAAGSLVLSTAAEQAVHNWMISPDRNLTLTSALQVRVGAAIGADLEGRDLGDGSITLTSTGGAIRILADISTTGDLTLDASTLINLNAGAGAKTLSGANVTLTGAVLSNRDLTLTATGALTLNSNITLTGTGLTLALSGAGAIGDGGTATVLTASTVSLTQAEEFAEDAQFTFGSTTGSLEFTTAANQDVHDWMINDGINLTVTSTRRVSVEDAIGGSGARVLGTGALTLTSTGGVVRILANITTGGAITLTSTGGVVRIFANLTTTGGAITLDGATGIDTSGGPRTFSGEGITLNGAVTSTGADIIINANGGILSLNGNVDTRDVTDPATPAFGGLTLEGATIQIGRAASTPANTRILLRGGNIMLTAANGIQIGRFNRGGGFRSNSDAANLTVRAISALTIAGSITVDSTSTSGGDIALTGSSSIDFGAEARTITGRAITLTGAATGTANLTITASGTLTINSDITLTGSGLTLALSGADVIGNGGNFGADRLMLTAGTVSLRQDAAFGARPFNFGTPATPIGSLALTTEAAQDVLDWMIVVGRNLNVTSAANVFVRSAIGSSVDGRNLGDGSITLTSTGGAIRILADISTTGDLTLAASTLINLNGGAAGVRTLAGAIVTLTGNALSNRDLTITATGVLTINNNINIGTGTLDLTATGGFMFAPDVDLTAGDHIFDPTRTCDGSTADPTCTDTTP